MRIKRITTVSVAILLVTTLVSILVNIESHKHYKTVDALDSQCHALVALYNSGELPIRVLNNIISQGPTDNPEKAANLEAAYESNKESLERDSERALALLDDMGDALMRFRGIFNIYVTTGGLEDQLERTRESYVYYRALIDLYINADQWSVAETEAMYFDLDVEVDGLLESFKVYSHDLRSKLLLHNNVITIVTLLELLILAFVIYRLLYRDMPFILSGFRNLENHDYEVDKIEGTRPVFKEEKEVYDMVLTIFNEQRDSTAFKNQVMATYLMDDIIDKLYTRVNHLFPIERIGIAFVDYSKEKIIAEYGVLKSGQIKLGPGYQVDFKNTSLTNIFESKEGYINNDLLSHYKNYNRSGALGQILGEGLRSNMVVPLLSNNTVYGLLFFSSKEAAFFTEDHYRIVHKLAYEISGFLNRAYLTKVILSKITASFAELVDKKDNETGGHILRMVTYSSMIAKSLSDMQLKDYPVDKEMILAIKRNAAIHDIGKVGIPDAILKKPGKLTSDEWTTMKTHAEIGGEIFKGIRKDMSMFDHDFYAVAEDIARYHHEKYDGSGYPEGLKGNAIPLVARIVALGDVFDALTCKRVYKDAFTFEEAVAIIHKDKGSHFDPGVVDAFDRIIKDIHEVYKAHED